MKWFNRTNLHCTRDAELLVTSPFLTESPPFLSNELSANFPRSRRYCKGHSSVLWHCEPFAKCLLLFPEWVHFSSIFPNVHVYLNNKTGKECQVMSAVLFDKLLNNLSFFFFLFCNSSWLTFNQKKDELVYLLKHTSHRLLPPNQLFSAILQIVPAYTNSSQNSSEL